MDFSSPDTWRWVFLVLAVAFTVGEIALAGTFFLLPFATGAAVAAVAGFVGASVGVMWLLFVLVSAVASSVLWPLRRRLDARNPRSEIGANRWVGRQAYVLRDIPGRTGETGLVRLDREEWRAESLVGVPIPAGSTVLVSRVDGTRLVVLPLDEPSSLPPIPE
ncbi:MAG TPA: NfeD family protein [Acidimicrobiales bacterium]|jgi:membrane protein implicated in regulation of membrane protease activity|nr:NfeD family protein [Acidimicrobiales bacterium]